jgi:hypothetical protein
MVKGGTYFASWVRPHCGQAIETMNFSDLRWTCRGVDRGLVSVLERNQIGAKAGRRCVSFLPAKCLKGCSAASAGHEDRATPTYQDQWQKRIHLPSRSVWLARDAARMGARRRTCAYQVDVAATMMIAFVADLSDLGQK